MRGDPPPDTAPLELDIDHPGPNSRASQLARPGGPRRDRAEFEVLALGDAGELGGGGDPAERD